MIGLQRPSPDDWRVLVLEDEFFIADDLGTALALHGAVVIGPVPSCAEALALVEAGERIDCAVLDISLNGESSFAVADALLARQVPFVFATGYELRSAPARFQGVGFWEKPYDVSALARHLVSLGRRRVGLG